MINPPLYGLIKTLVIAMGAVEIPLGLFCATCLGRWLEGKKKKWFRLFLWSLGLDITLYSVDYFLWFVTMEMLQGKI